MRYHTSPPLLQATRVEDKAGPAQVQLVQGTILFQRMQRLLWIVALFIVAMLSLLVVLAMQDNEEEEGKTFLVVPTVAPTMIPSMEPSWLRIPRLPPRQTSWLPLINIHLSSWRTRPTTWLWRCATIPMGLGMSASRKTLPTPLLSFAIPVAPSLTRTFQQQHAMEYVMVQNLFVVGVRPHNDWKESDRANSTMIHSVCSGSETKSLFLLGFPGFVRRTEQSQPPPAPSMQQ